MRFVSCQACKRAVQIGGDQAEIKSLLGEVESFPCTTPLCRGRMLATAPTKIPQGYAIEEVPIRGFFRAINGFGPGKGAPASKKRLQELLLSQRVVEVVATSIGQPERVIVRELVLENGVRLHFETSARGACIYYIEEPENEQVGDAAVAAEGRNPNREEARRAPQAEPGGSSVTEGTVGEPRAPELPDSERVSIVSETGGVHSDSVSRRTEPNSGSGVRV